MIRSSAKVVPLIDGLTVSCRACDVFCVFWFCVDDLCFAVTDERLWAVGCNGGCLVFDSSELIPSA